MGKPTIFLMDALGGKPTIFGNTRLDMQKNDETNHLWSNTKDTYFPAIRPSLLAAFSRFAKAKHQR